MSEAVLSVSFAGPLVTLQDAGRPGNLRFGVAASGPMDRLAFAAGQAALGNPAGGTAIEVSLGGVILSCTAGAVSVAVTGGDFLIDHAGQRSTGWQVLALQKGDKLTLRAGRAGSWAYLGFAGTLRVAPWLGSSATHSTSRFGGGLLASGQALTIEEAALREGHHGEIALPEITDSGPIRVVMGPQDQHFEAEALETFLSTDYAVSDSYDRMGMRLQGSALAMKAALSIPSEPITRGSVQVSGDGVPTVLLADHQTTGGYPKIATVISCDTDRLSQFRSGDKVRFQAISAEDALAAQRRYLEARDAYLERVAVPRGTLAERLMRENLNHGWHEDQS